MGLLFSLLLFPNKSRGHGIAYSYQKKRSARNLKASNRNKVQRKMKYAIIAAGEGSRLQQEGVNLPKPLVRIGGESMIDRLIRIFRNNGAEEICIIVNTL
ncbi:protein containing Nucleotidyl transferase domain protein, partial [gut metagenome]